MLKTDSIGRLVITCKQDSDESMLLTATDRRVVIETSGSIADIKGDLQAYISDMEEVSMRDLLEYFDQAVVLGRNEAITYFRETADRLERGEKF